MKKNGKHKVAEPLSKREKQILWLMADGLTDKEIAKKLAISHDTAESHRSNIIKKLNAKNVSNAIVIALRQNIII
ncbi:MAG: response regulator transcription factor [Chitinophagales bacterium]|nr:response regulator transcription factor [Chitinophagales bacterium]